MKRKPATPEALAERKRRAQEWNSVGFEHRRGRKRGPAKPTTNDTGIDPPELETDSVASINDLDTGIAAALRAGGMAPAADSEARFMRRLGFDPI